MEAPFSAFTDGRPEKQDSWSWGCARKEKKKVEIIEEELRRLMRHGLDRVRVFHTLYRRQVTPLAVRAWPMWRYDGPSDPDRALPGTPCCRTMRFGVAPIGCYR